MAIVTDITGQQKTPVKGDGLGVMTPDGSVIHSDWCTKTITDEDIKLCRIFVNRFGLRLVVKKGGKIYTIIP